jgi:hypothetical protein
MNGTWAREGKGNGIGVIIFATAENATTAQDVVKPPAGQELVPSDLYEVGARA